MIKLALSVLFVLLSTAAAAVPAQQPVKVDVMSLEFQQTTSPDTHFTLTARDSSGTEIVYSGDGNFALLPLYQCSPCDIPNRFDTVTGFLASMNGARGFAFRWGNHVDNIAYVYVAEAGSEELIVSPRYTWRSQSISFNGPTFVRLKVEIRDQHGAVVAYSDDTDLTGGYSAVMRINNASNNGRLLYFSSIRFDLAGAAGASQ